MHIAYLTTEYPAISHSFIRREIKAMEARGHAIDRFTIRPPGRLLSAEDKDEATRTVSILGQGGLALVAAAVAQVTRPHAWLHGLTCALGMYRKAGSGMVRHLAYFAEACWLLRCLRASRVEHVHVHFGTNSTAVARIVRAMGGPPYSFTVHGPDEFDRPAALDLGGKVADAKAAVAISDFGRGQLMRWSRLEDWPRLGVARCSIDASFRDEPDEGTPDAPAFVAVGRLAAQKGLPLLIEAAALVKSRGADVRLVIVGDGPLRGELEAMVRRLGLAANVTFTGALDGDGVRRAMLAARAFVLPSFAEGLPVVIMEALALRRPVVVSAIAGTPELVDEGCGWLVPAGSVERLADAMVEALRTAPERLHAMGEEGRRRVLQRHDSDANAAALSALIGAS